MWVHTLILLVAEGLQYCMECHILHYNGTRLYSKAVLSEIQPIKNIINHIVRVLFIQNLYWSLSNCIKFLCKILILMIRLNTSISSQSSNKKYVSSEQTGLRLRKHDKLHSNHCWHNLLTKCSSTICAKRFSPIPLHFYIYEISNAKGILLSFQQCWAVHALDTGTYNGVKTSVSGESIAKYLLVVV